MKTEEEEKPTTIRAKNAVEVTEVVVDDDEDPDFKFGASSRNSKKRPSSSNNASKAKRPKIERCPSCRADLASSDLKFYLGHPEGALEEDIALFQPSLLIDSTGTDDEPLFDGYNFEKPG